MHAIGEYLDLHSPQSSRTYISSDRFMNEMINAIRFDRTIDFRARYRSTDILLVDDIQFLASREGTQIEFFHTFNSLYDAQKQIVISSDCAPHELQFLEERLRSRFEWGLTVDIQPPDLETRVAILKKKAEHLAPAIPIDDEVALYIAERIKSNIRELEGSLTTLIARASLWRRKINLALAQEVLPNIGDRDRPVVTIEIIQKHVANHYSLKLSELKSRNNSQTIVLPRQVAMYLARTLTGASYPQIARKFGKHYSTVIYAYDKIEEERGHDKSLDALIDGFIKSIKKSVD
jgi:chromosomal replication initiator protein